MSTNKIDNRVIFLAVLLAILALVAKPVWDGRDQSQFGAGRDDGVYMVTAKSLASGEGFRQENLPGRPYSTKYPPLFPLYMSIAWRLVPSFPRVLLTASILQAAVLPVCLAFLLLMLRQMEFSWRRTILISAMTFVSFKFVFLAVTLFSDLLFGCFLLAAIWILEVAAEQDRDRFSQQLAMLGGLLTGLAYLTRNAALPMLIAVPFFLLLRKKLKLNIGFFAAALPIMAGWHLWMMLHSSAMPHATYLDEYLSVIRTKGLLLHLGTQWATLSAAVAEAFLPGSLGFLHGIPLHHLVLAAAITGGIRIGRRRRWPLYLIFTGPYLIMITSWWWGGLDRLVIPVWPMLLAGIAAEADHFANLSAASIKRPALKSVPRWAIVVVGLLIVVWSDRFTWQKMASIYQMEIEQSGNDQRAYAWVREHATAGSIVLAWKDTTAYLYTGLPSSHDLFVAKLPETEAEVGLRPSFSIPPGEYKSAFLLLLGSDFVGEQLDHFGSLAAKVPGSTLELSSPSALVYRFPLPETRP